VTADQVRSVLTDHEPVLLALADGLRETFGARFDWLKTPAFEVGKRPDLHSRSVVVL
jgi:hypothetical protein